MLVAMMGLIKPGDEVITADFTFAATVSNCIVATNPVLVDVDLYNMNISIDGIRKAITQKRLYWFTCLDVQPIWKYYYWLKNIICT
jgi:dTDP-4-amino-4,6-dideoxygalactose transaminase